MTDFNLKCEKAFEYLLPDRDRWFDGDKFIMKSHPNKVNTFCTECDSKNIPMNDSEWVYIFTQEQLQEMAFNHYSKMYPRWEKEAIFDLVLVMFRKFTERLDTGHIHNWNKMWLCFVMEIIHGKSWSCEKEDWI